MWRVLQQMGKQKRKLDALRYSMDILIAGLGVLICFELKGNLIDSTAWTTGETGDNNRKESDFNFLPTSQLNQKKDLIIKPHQNITNEKKSNLHF